MKSTNFIKKLREEQSTVISETEELRLLTAKDAMIKPAFIYQDEKANKIIKRF